MLTALQQMSDMQLSARFIKDIVSSGEKSGPEQSRTRSTLAKTLVTI